MSDLYSRSKEDVERCAADRKDAIKQEEKAAIARADKDKDCAKTHAKEERDAVDRQLKEDKARLKEMKDHPEQFQAQPLGGAPFMGQQPLAGQPLMGQPIAGTTTVTQTYSQVTQEKPVFPQGVAGAPTDSRQVNFTKY